jgi:hypothetical protein
MTTEPQNNTRELRREHEIQVGNLSTPICLRIYRRKADGMLLIEQSHFIKTGIQYLPYALNEFQTSDETLDEDMVVSNLEKTILGFYDQAVRRGHIPSESWLVPNSAFDK